MRRKDNIYRQFLVSGGSVDADCRKKAPEVNVEDMGRKWEDV